MLFDILIVSVKEFHSLTPWIDKHIAFELVRDCNTTNELVLRVLCTSILIIIIIYIIIACNCVGNSQANAVNTIIPVL